MTNTKYIQATGRHKEAIAQVRIQSGSGKIIVNFKNLDDQALLNPLKMVGIDSKFDVSVIVKGGGIVGQKKAISLGLARAIVSHDAETKTTLKKAGMLMRDPRVRERKKYGKKSARRSPQWSKR